MNFKNENNTTSQNLNMNLDLNPNYQRLASVYVVDIGQASENIHSNMDYILPRVIASKEEIKIEIKAEVDIAEQFRDNYKDNFNKAFIDEVERTAARKVEHELTQTIKYVQEEFGADILLFNVAMQRYAPNTWDEVKDNWSELFQNLDVNVNAVVDVRKRGLIK